MEEIIIVVTINGREVRFQAWIIGGEYTYPEIRVEDSVASQIAGIEPLDLFVWRSNMSGRLVRVKKRVPIGGITIFYTEKPPFGRPQGW